MTRYSVSLRLLLLAVILAGTGCTTVKGWFDREEPTETLPVEQMYDEAKTSLDNGNTTRASKFYTRLIARFPYGQYTEQAQLELAYAQYKSNKYEDASSTIARFIRTYPAHRHIDYAYYLRGLINFNRDNALLEQIARLDMTLRDQGAPRQSFNDFAELISRYPNSIYVADARQRMVYLRNQLARYELNVGLYYLRRDANVAAANRAEYLLQQYPQSQYDGDAVALLGEAYTRLGQDQLAADARKVLQLNHPDHPWLAGGWPARSGFLGRLRQLNPFAAGQ